MSEKEVAYFQIEIGERKYNCLSVYEVSEIGCRNVGRSVNHHAETPG